MKAKNLVTAAAVSAALSFSVTSHAKEEKQEEQTINSSDVPAAVQQAVQSEAKGGSIVRWEKEGAPIMKSLFKRRESRLALRWTRTVKC